MQETNIMKTIYKILGILAVIFCGIALVVPWAGLWYGQYGFNIYTWAASVNVPGYDKWDFFFAETMTSSTFTTQGVVLGVCMILAFVFTLIALFFGIYAIRKINAQTSSNSFLITGILCIVAMVLSIIGVSQIPSSTLGGLSIGYGAGFFLIIVAMILYFVIFALQKILPTYAPAMGQPMYYQQPQAQYYTQQPQAPPVQEQPYTQPVEQQPPSRARQQPRAAPKFCPECGSPIPPNSKFCAGCGNKIA